MIESQAARDAVADRIEEALNDFLRPVGRYLMIEMRNRRVLQAPKCLCDVSADVDPGALWQARRRLALEHATNEIGERRIAYIFVCIVETRESAEIGQSRLRGVEHPHLDQFMPCDVADELGARCFPA